MQQHTTFNQSEGSKSAKFNNIATQAIEAPVDVFDMKIPNRKYPSSSIS